MYYLSKIVWFFLEPSNLLVILIAAGFLLSLRAPRAGRALALVGLVMIAIVGLSPLGTMLLRPLEQRFPAFGADAGPVAGAIILGGALDPEVTDARGQLALNEAGERVTAMLEIARRYPQARLVFTGGSGDIAGVLSEAVALERHIARLAPDLRIEWERASRNTVENAALTKAMVQPLPGARWLLVTSAWHMPRSIGIFRKAGFDVVPYPVDFRTTGTGLDMRPSLSISHGLRRTDLATKEWVGILFAYLTGKSAALFPAP